MTDTRKQFSKGVPGFKPGQLRWNQTKSRYFGNSQQYEAHATIEVMDKTKEKKEWQKKMMVREFHVSLYLWQYDDTKRRLGGIYWSYNHQTDTYAYSGWDGINLCTNTWNDLLRVANQITSKLKFGSSGIARAI